MSIKANWDNFLAGFFLILGGITALFVISGLFLIVFKLNPTNIFLNEIKGVFCDKAPGIKLTKAELQTLHTLIDKGAILSPDTIFSQISSYYNTLICFLIGLLSSMGVLAFISIRNISSKHAEDEVEKGVDRHFESQSFADRVKKYVDGEIDFRMADFEIPADVKKRLDKLDEDLEAFRAGQPAELPDGIRNKELE